MSNTQREIGSMAREIMSLREALRPFAEMDTSMYCDAPDECVMTGQAWGNEPRLVFRLGDLRRAHKEFYGLITPAEVARAIGAKLGVCDGVKFLPKRNLRGQS
jgi:hypothetical protein